MPKECSFAPLDVCCKLGEPNEVFSSLVILLHMESFKLGLGFAYGIVGTEVQFKFLDEKSKSDSHAGSLSTKSLGSKHSNAMPLRKERM